MINSYVCLLNLCKPFFSENNDKARSIDPEYFVYNARTRSCKYEKINKKDPPMMDYKEK